MTLWREFLNWYIGGAFYSWSRCKSVSISEPLRHLCETLAINRNDSIETLGLTQFIILQHETLFEIERVCTS